jgi:hypothetical protein
MHVSPIGDNRKVCQRKHTSKFCDATSGEARMREHPRPPSTQILASGIDIRNSVIEEKWVAYSPQAPPTFFCLSKPKSNKSIQYAINQAHNRRPTFPELIDRGTRGFCTDIQQHTNYIKKSDESN